MRQLLTEDMTPGTSWITRPNKGTHTISKKIEIRRNQRVITLRINSAREPMEFYRRTYGTRLRLCQVELRFSSCECVYSQENMRPVH